MSTISVSRSRAITTPNLEADFASHPAELVEGGVSLALKLFPSGGLNVLVQKINSKYTTSDLRNAIPPHCFKSSYRLSFWYLCRDFIVAGALMAMAFKFIPMINLPLARYVAWATYGYVQGQQMTGIWVCGRAALDSYSFPNRAK